MQIAMNPVDFSQVWKLLCLNWPRLYTWKANNSQQLEARAVDSASTNQSPKVSAAI